MRSAVPARLSLHLVKPALAITLVLAIASFSVVFTPAVAEAASAGPGFAPANHSLLHLGGYFAPDGRVSYCIEAGLQSAIGGHTTDDGLVGQVNGLDEASMIRLNLVLSRHGETTDNTTAAAVALAVWGIADAANFAIHGGDAAALRRAPSSERAAIQILTDQFRAEAAAWVAEPAEALMTLSIDPETDYSGHIEVALTPATAIGTVQLTNGIFSDTGKSSRAGVSNGVRLAVRATPPALSTTPYRITARADDFTAQTGFSATVRVYRTPGSQTIVASGSPSSVVFAATAIDLRDRLVPRLNTSAQSAAIVSGTVADVAHVTNAPSIALQLKFSGYLQPVGSSQPQCTQKTLVFTSTQPVEVGGDGDYPSERFSVTNAQIGIIYWVATATIDGVVVSQGACGEANEVSTLSAPPAPPEIHLPVVSA